MAMTTEIDLSRMPVDEQSGEFQQAAPGNVVNGAAGGRGGGSNGTYKKPNIGIALKIEPIKPDLKHFVKLGPKARAVDDEGGVMESPDLGPTVLRFAEFERRHPDMHYVYLYREARTLPRLTQLDVELLVIPGRKRSVTFDGAEKQKKQSSDKKTFALKSVKKTDKGIEIDVQFPESAKGAKTKTPQASRGSNSAVLEDNQGNLYPFIGASGFGGMQQSLIINGGVAQGFANSGANPGHTFRFHSLPADRELKAIHMTQEERLGEPEPVRVSLQNSSP
jgi:hypothetical protein